jgi:hypothetical protein
LELVQDASETLAPHLDPLRRSHPGTLPDSVSILVNLDPIAVRVLKIDLFYSIRPESDTVSSAFPVIIWNPELAQMAQEFLQRWNRKGEMHIASSWSFTAGDEMQLIMLANLEPNVPIVLERIRNNFGLDDFCVKRRASLKIRHVESNVVKMTLQDIRRYPRSGGFQTAA